MYVTDLRPSESKHVGRAVRLNAIEHKWIESALYKFVEHITIEHIRRESDSIATVVYNPSQHKTDITLPIWFQISSPQFMHK